MIQAFARSRPRTKASIVLGVFGRKFCGGVHNVECVWATQHIEAVQDGMNLAGCELLLNEGRRCKVSCDFRLPGQYGGRRVRMRHADGQIIELVELSEGLVGSHLEQDRLKADLDGEAMQYDRSR